jgi:hypothetical protein
MGAQRQRDRRRDPLRYAIGGGSHRRVAYGSIVAAVVGGGWLSGGALALAAVGAGALDGGGGVVPPTAVGLGVLTEGAATVSRAAVPISSSRGVSTARSMASSRAVAARLAASSLLRCSAPSSASSGEGVERDQVTAPTATAIAATASQAARDLTGGFSTLRTEGAFVRSAPPSSALATVSAKRPAAGESPGVGPPTAAASTGGGAPRVVRTRRA